MTLSSSSPSSQEIIENDANVVEIKAVLFDLDGTLLDTEVLSDRAILQAFGNKLSPEILEERKKDGYRIPWELKKQILGKRGQEWGPIVIQYAQNHWGIDHNFISWEELWQQWETNLNSLCESVEECKGATKLVESLAKAGIPMAIATSSRKAGVEKKKIRHNAIFRHMTTIVTGDDPAVLNGKPAPDIYLEAAKRLGISPQQCLVVEDSTSGCQSGMAAQCHVLAVPDPRLDPNAFDNIAHNVLTDLNQFFNLYQCKHSGDGKPFLFKFKGDSQPPQEQEGKSTIIQI